MDLFEKCDHFETLKKVRQMGIYPYFHELESRQAPIVKMENHRVIMLGSNNYLGFTENEAVIKAGHEALDKYGTGVSGSRFLNGTLDIASMKKLVDSGWQKARSSLFSYMKRKSPA